MNAITLEQIADWSGGALIQGSPNDAVTAVSTDSRTVSSSELFVALKGDRFDAHDFLEGVAERQAGAVLVHSLTSATEAFPGGIVHVKNTLSGLQGLARGYRKSLSGIRVVGLTGSNGKTSTKDFLAAVLSTGFSVNKTKGNLNNHIGVPLTILGSDSTHDFGIWEMGMNHSGEIEVLAEMAQPNVAVVTNIGTAHIENLESREAIAEEKSQLPAMVPAEGYCVMPRDNDFFDFVSEQVQGDMVSIGFEKGDLRAENLHVSDSGKMSFDLVSEFADSFSITLPVRGRHMVSNALLAAAVGFREGLTSEQVAEGLGSVELTGGRLEEKTIGGFAILDDSYNANPDSMRAALTTLQESTVSGRRVAVLGFMGELGHIEEEAHLTLGEEAVRLGVDILVTVGDKAARINQRAEELAVNLNFSSHEEAAEFLRDELTSGDLTLVKGSRGATMEKVIKGLVE
ncbi:MAG: UDP-N-acetylmuramoyl-tripeptide--D-alanyl-D-alanine ligase [Verrucomicrobiota bacterium]